MVNGAKLAIADLNKRGGVLGKKFSLQSYNDQASATLSSQLFQRLVSAGAVAIAGSGDTGPATSAMAQRLQRPEHRRRGRRRSHDLPERAEQAPVRVGLELGPEHVRLGRDRRAVRHDALQGPRRPPRSRRRTDAAARPASRSGTRRATEARPRRDDQRGLVDRRHRQPDQRDQQDQGRRAPTALSSG